MRVSSAEPALHGEEAHIPALGGGTHDGASMVPMPPMTTMKIMYAVQLMLNAASGEIRSRFR
jgi:hypothetical protein